MLNAGMDHILAWCLYHGIPSRRKRRVLLYTQGCRSCCQSKQPTNPCLRCCVWLGWNTHHTSSRLCKAEENIELSTPQWHFEVCRIQAWRRKGGGQEDCRRIWRRRTEENKASAPCSWCVEVPLRAGAQESSCDKECPTFSWSVFVHSWFSWGIWWAIYTCELNETPLIFLRLMGTCNTTKEDSPESPGNKYPNPYRNHP